MSYKVAYYAHHFGTGHLRHAQRLAELGGLEVQVASTGERRTDLLSADVEYVALPPDAGPGQHPGKMRPGDPLHYAPVGTSIQQRFALLNRAWERFTPNVVMVDVSVEVALFARLSGYPVAFRRMPGDREDPAHQMAYAVSDVIFAYFPSALEHPAHLNAYGAKSHYLGAPMHGCAKQLPVSVPYASVDQRRVVVQTSLASSIPLRHLAAAAAASPLWQWRVAGAVEDDGSVLPRNLQLLGVLGDPGLALRNADVVISSAGHNAVVAAAASGRPVLLVPEPRPHDEQLEFARALGRTAGIPHVETWGLHTDWETTLERVAGSVPGALAESLFVSEGRFTAAVESMLADCVQRAGS
ncbi:MAG: glycosyltransferase [Micrococcaceae bacterium]|nr:glycosyltransferase [Micrococcaceae bacterium]